FSFVFFFSSRRRHTRFSRDWSSDVCSSDLDATTGNSRRRLDRIGRGRSLSCGTSLVILSACRVRPVLWPVLRWCFSVIRAHWRRSEERRVGKEWACRGVGEDEKRKESGGRG